MIVLGLESSAHTFGAGVVKNGRVLANEKSMYRIGSGGMIPAKVARFHAENARFVIEKALESSGLGFVDIEGIGYTKGPGLGPCLQVAQLYAKTMARRLKVGIAPVNHCVAHIEITRHTEGLRDPVMLYVSGGNSQILKLVETPYLHYRVIGETLDIGVGNMLDAFARKMGLDPAWGSSVERCADKGRYIKLPYNVKGMDFSFTGLLTKASGLIEHKESNDLCFSLQETSFSMLCEATERALMLTKSREIGLCGGVAQNKRLADMLRAVAEEHNARFGCAPNEFNADNGAMIAYVAEKMLASGFSIGPEGCDVKQRYRSNEARVFR